MKCAERRFTEDALRLDLGAVLRSCRVMTPTPAARWPASPGAATFVAVPVNITRCGFPVGQVLLDVMRSGRLGQVQVIAGHGAGSAAETRADAVRVVGYRWTFECPVTGQRCRSLYLPAGAIGFASRQAHGLTYRSLYEPRLERRFRKATKLRHALGEVPALVGGELPPAPVGMLARTHRRRCAKIQAVEGLLEVAW